MKALRWNREPQPECQCGERQPRRGSPSRRLYSSAEFARCLRRGIERVPRSSAVSITEHRAHLCLQRRQTDRRTGCQSVSHGRTGRQVERWRLEDALPLCVCEAAGPAGRGDSEIVAVLQPTNKLQRGRGGGRREGEREPVPAIIYVLFVFFILQSPPPHPPSCVLL